MGHKSINYMTALEEKIKVVFVFGVVLEVGIISSVCFAHLILGKKKVY